MSTRLNESSGHRSHVASLEDRLWNTASKPRINTPRYPAMDFPPLHQQQAAGHSHLLKPWPSGEFFPFHNFKKLAEISHQTPSAIVASTAMATAASLRPLLLPSHYIPPLKIELEPAVMALDLRICKQNASISQCDLSEVILGEEPSPSPASTPHHSPKRNTPSPLPPPSPLAASLSFNRGRSKTPLPPFPPEASLHNLSPLERMKIIGAHHMRFRERHSQREASEFSSMDSKIRKIHDISSKTQNLVVLPSRSHALTSLGEEEALAASAVEASPSLPSFLCPRRVQLKRHLSPHPLSEGGEDLSSPSDLPKKSKRGRPRKHSTKVPLPPLYVFIRNLIYNEAYTPRVVSWVNERAGIFKVNQTGELAKTWGKMKRNRSEEMNYEKMSRAMRYHYGNEKQGRKGHLAMVKEKRLVYQFGELAINWRAHEINLTKCKLHILCRGSFCLWSKE